jgi:imidazolonepropionase-like amidohydrolase
LSKKIKIPANVTVIDGTGKFLALGLTDAHIHFSQDGG